MSLDLLLIEDLRMWPFNKKFDKGRRDALKGIGAAAALIGAGMMPTDAYAGVDGTLRQDTVQNLTMSNGKIVSSTLRPETLQLLGIRRHAPEYVPAMHTAISYYSEILKNPVPTGYPPGIINSKYKKVLTQMWDTRTNIEELSKYVGFHSVQSKSSPLFTKENGGGRIFLEEPAVYLLASFLYENLDIYIQQTKIKLDKNSPLREFAKGIGYYTTAYMFMGYQQPNIQTNIEYAFLNSLFKAGNYKEGLDKYVKAKDKDPVLQELINRLKNESKEMQLVAAWSIKCLTDSYYLMGNSYKIQLFEMEKLLNETFNINVRGSSKTGLYFSTKKGLLF